ncbi:MAG: AAA family ATPase [Oscillospiraceae bacterium]|nr:AAA family ATPase [Oscillospiraceae bacterium]
MESNTNKLILNMSPRALDELKKTGISDVSKYELPMTVFPEGKAFYAKIAMQDGLLILNFNTGGVEFSLKGVLDNDVFSCRSVSLEPLDSNKAVSVCFTHLNQDGVFHINEALRERLDMWYEYINSLLEKSGKSKALFCCEEVLYRSGDTVRIKTLGLDGKEIKNLSVGTADEKGEPVFSVGKADDYRNNILTVKLSGNKTDVFNSGQRLVIYDAAAEITCKRMKSGLDKLCRGEAVNKRLPEFIFNPEKANRKPGDNVILSAENLLAENMNPEQIEAVEGVLNAEDLYLIQGPPGTGKTTVIAEICYQNAIRGLKTLVVSQSNLAVDNAISRVMNHTDVRVLRKGDSSRVEEEGLPFVEDNVVRTWIKQISDSSENMSKNIDERTQKLNSYIKKLPDLMELSERISEGRKTKNYYESQIHFYKNVLKDAKEKRAAFFELIAKAYENDDLSAAEKARNFYPEDFIIPNGIYNDISGKYMDMKADIEKIREYENELNFFNDYTNKFTEQFDYIEKSAGSAILDKTFYDGEFYYAGFENTESLYEEGEKIINAEPFGIKRLLFGRKWRKLAAVYYRRTENFMVSIQVKTIKLCDKIEQIKKSEVFVFNSDCFHTGLDALCEDYDSQYYSVKSKYNTTSKEYSDLVRDYNYNVELLREEASERFYMSALCNIDLSKIDPDKMESCVMQKYNDFKFRYDTWKKLILEWKSKISGSGMNYNSLKKLYIDNANVIGITCIQSGTKDFNENYPVFDVVIIDESSKSTPPDIILPMLKGKKIVLVGDHKQLPPFIDMNAYDEIESENDGSLKELMKISLFEELYEKAETGTKTMLYRQYRMHRDIAGLVNQFYINTDAGRLESPSVSPKEHMCYGFDIEEDNHVLWYDVPNITKYYENMRNKSFYNEFEVSCVKKILSMLNSNLVKNNAQKGIGIITFYDAQVKLLESELIYSGFYKTLSNVNIRIGSVDRFQGMEEDIIIMSFVRNNVGHNIGFAKDGRRINVAMSRAKELLVIVGCLENFINSSNHESSEMFRNIYQITERLSGIRNAEQIPDAQQPGESTYYKEYHKTGISDSAYSENEENDYDDTGMNILDYFILKSALEFKGRRITVSNISNVLGIAPVFIKNRVEYLCSEGNIECQKQCIKITDKGAGAINSKVIGV